MAHIFTNGLILKSLLLIAVLSMVACTSKVHVRLFAANLSSEDLVKIEEKFKSSKLRYSTTEAPFPAPITGNSIIYNSSIDSSDRIYNIMDVLKSIDFDIFQASMFEVENHSFTANNVGLYLFSNGYEPKQEEKAPFAIDEYGSVECGSNLTLEEDSTFNVLFEIWDAGLDDYRESLVTGLWHEQRLGDIVLSSEYWRAELYFEKRINIESKPTETVATISLVPKFNSKTSDFYLKEKDSQLNVNCVYQARVVY